MESTQDRLGHNLLINRNAVSAQSGPLLAGPQVGDAWSETRMWPAPIVVCDPLFEKAPQVYLVERNQKIEAFAANRTDQSLTERVGLSHQLHVLQTV
jgi:hypothetical protein